MTSLIDPNDFTISTSRLREFFLSKNFVEVHTQNRLSIDWWYEEGKSNMTQEEFNQDFYCEYGFVSCFECDETFTDIEELKEHEKKHLEQEQCLK